VSERVLGTIEVDAPPEIVFDVSNDMERWPDIMAGYRSVRIVGKEGHKVWFDIERVDDSSWRSWRVLRRDLMFAYAERHSPLHPFKFMHILWSYSLLGPTSTLMTWDMEFELSDGVADAASWLRTFEDHTESNLAAMKTYIENLVSP
jgi:ribosome-associated toxin RatA of RatAB toxin-antitoxin module